MVLNTRIYVLLVLALAQSLNADDAARAARTCATCHAAQARPHPITSMAHALESVAECAILREHPLLTFAGKGYTYTIERKGDQSIYTVSNGKESLSLPIAWAVGLGFAGQTYLLEKDGQWYESLVSFYKASNALDITMGAQGVVPTNLLEAAGRLRSEQDTVACFNCHSTNAVSSSNKLTLNSLTAGVQCERCHGDTEHHIAGIKAGDAKLAAMKKLGAQAPEEMNQFCGQCHGTWERIASSGPHGALNVRFQPYRLTNSKCYDVDDSRIKCTACHDPHRELDRVSINYDAKCQACHAGAKPEARMCKVAKKDCASCHMPRIELPGAHHAFTDHNIRIVKSGVYPD